MNNSNTSDESQPQRTAKSGTKPGLWVAACLMIGGMIGLPEFLMPGLSPYAMLLGFLIGVVHGLTHGFKPSTS